MTLISYAQNFEDVMLWRALKHVENGFYIDVGAAWPDEHSVTKAFYDKGWRGINVEPNPRFNTELTLHRPRDINLRVAVGEKEESATFHLVPDTGLSTLDHEIATKHRLAGWAPEDRLVEVKTLASIFDAHVPIGQAVHFLKIDVEGFEGGVIKGNDWQRNRPWIVVVEATLPMSQIESHQDWEPILSDARYSLVYADGLNRFYVASEHAELLSAFNYPPNFFDDFKLHSQHISEIRTQQAEARAQQAEARAQQAEIRVSEAETANRQYQDEIDALRNSTSWRLTSPLRWLVLQARLLKQNGTKSRLKAFIGKALRRINAELLKRPKLRHTLIRYVHKTGIHPLLKRLMAKADMQGARPLIPPPPLFCIEQFQPTLNMTPRALEIYNELKKAIDSNRDNRTN